MHNARSQIVALIRIRQAIAPKKSVKKKQEEEFWVKPLEEVQRKRHPTF
jgi:hypothetical protein